MRRVVEIHSKVSMLGLMLFLTIAWSISGCGPVPYCASGYMGGTTERKCSTHFDHQGFKYEDCYNVSHPKYVCFRWTCEAGYDYVNNSCKSKNQPSANEFGDSSHSSPDVKNASERTSKMSEPSENESPGLGCWPGVSPIEGVDINICAPYERCLQACANSNCECEREHYASCLQLPEGLLCFEYSQDCRQAYRCNPNALDAIDPEEKTACGSRNDLELSSRHLKARGNRLLTDVKSLHMEWSCNY